jgi:hypothetical protein
MVVGVGIPVTLFMPQIPSRGSVATDPETYLTPSAEEKVKMSASLRAGTYDAGANILRTCSLPDLASLVADPEGPAWDAQEPPETGDNVSGGPDTGNVPGPLETEGKVPEPPARVPEDEEGANEDDVFYGDEAATAAEGRQSGGVSEEEEEVNEEEEWSSSEDEDLQQLVQTLQSFVEEASE